MLGAGQEGKTGILVAELVAGDQEVKIEIRDE
jgi:hypothetical protein